MRLRMRLMLLYQTLPLLEFLLQRGNLVLGDPVLVADFLVLLIVLRWVDLFGARERERERGGVVKLNAREVGVNEIRKRPTPPTTITTTTYIAELLLDLADSLEHDGVLLVENLDLLGLGLGVALETESLLTVLLDLLLELHALVDLVLGHEVGADNGGGQGNRQN